MRATALLLLCALDVMPSCGKHPRPAPIEPGTAAHPRSLYVKVSNQGYTPSVIRGRAGETVNLNFYYEASAGECGREVVLPQQNLHITLNEQQPSSVPLTLPASGEVAFNCGMNMLHGKIVVE